jgi:hypothetical protein
MMLVSQAIFTLMQRRAIGIILQCVLFLAGYFYIFFITPWVAEHDPKLAGFIVGTTVIICSVVGIFLFFRIVRLSFGIHQLKQIREYSELCPGYWMVKFESGYYDVL